MRVKLDKQGATVVSNFFLTDTNSGCHSSSTTSRSISIQSHHISIQFQVPNLDMPSVVFGQQESF